MPAPLHIDIKEPCHENWQQMTPNEQGRHCGSCRKTVVDFTRMSDQEILDYISRASSSVCGRFYNHQLDKTYTEQKIKPAFTFRYAWNLLVATFLLTGSAASAQVNKKAKKKAAVKKEWEYKYTLEHLKLNPKDFSINIDLEPVPVRTSVTLGFVVSTDYIEQQRSHLVDPPLKMFGFIRDNNTGNPVEAASVRLKGVKAGIEAGEDGRFEFPIIGISGKVTLEVTAKGYITKEYLVDVNSFRPVDFFLESDGTVQPEDEGFALGKVDISPVMGEVVVKDTTPVQTKEVSAPEGITMGTPAVRIPDVDDYGELIGYGISGVILDDKTGKAVSFASVRIKDEKAGIAADEAGVFNIMLPAEKGKLTIEVSAVGYATHEFMVVPKYRKSYSVRLQPAADSLQPVEIIAYPPIVCKIGTPNPQIDKAEMPISIDSALQGKVGGLTVQHEVTVVEKVKREVKEWLPGKKDVRIYPNPVTPGNAVNISLSLNKTGEYKLELMDVAGRVVYVQALQIAQKEQVANIPTQSTWSHGIYWIRISNATDKKVYQAKLLLQ